MSSWKTGSKSAWVTCVYHDRIFIFHIAEQSLQLGLKGPSLYNYMTVGFKDIGRCLVLNGRNTQNKHNLHVHWPSGLIFQPEVLLGLYWTVWSERRTTSSWENNTVVNAQSGRDTFLWGTWPHGVGLLVDMFLPVIRRWGTLRNSASKKDVPLALLHHTLSFVVIIQRNRRGGDRLHIDDSFWISAIEDKINHSDDSQQPSRSLFKELGLGILYICNINSTQIINQINFDVALINKISKCAACVIVVHICNPHNPDANIFDFASVWL